MIYRIKQERVVSKQGQLHLSFKIGYFWSMSLSFSVLEGISLFFSIYSRRKSWFGKT